MELLWGTEMAVSFTNIFMAKVETEILSQSVTKLLVWKHFISIFSLGAVDRESLLNKLTNITLHSNSQLKYLIQKQHSWILKSKKDERLKKEAVLDVHTHFKPTETFQYTHYYSCQPPGVNFFLLRERL